MKREIKFRGFNKKNRVWLYGFYLQNRGAHFVCPDEFATGKDWDDYEIVPESLGEFAGLKDCNGHDIYEGDFVIFPYGFSGLVTWNKGGYFFIDENPDKEYEKSCTPLGEMLSFCALSVDAQRTAVRLRKLIEEND